jgi:endonuclease-3
MEDKLSPKKPSHIEVIDRLKKLYPGARTALDHKAPLEMLVATILSAQCTDKRVNIVTKELFKKYKTAMDYAGADVGELERIIRPAGFFRNKARSIIGAAQMIENKFGGNVPRTMEEMLLLPGVARKTANVVLSESYGVIVGIAVDTHVKRLSNRLGFTTQEDPVKIEQNLMNMFPEGYWYDVCNALISHGRNVCLARKPKCGECSVNDLCPSAFKIF